MCSSPDPATVWCVLDLCPLWSLVNAWGLPLARMLLVNITSYPRLNILLCDPVVDWLLTQSGVLYSVPFFANSSAVSCSLIPKCPGTLTSLTTHQEDHSDPNDWLQDHWCPLCASPCQFICNLISFDFPTCPGNQTSFTHPERPVLKWTHLVF